PGPGTTTADARGLSGLLAAALRESGVRSVLDTSRDGRTDTAAALADVPAGTAARTLVLPERVFADAETLRRLVTDPADICVLVDVTAAGPETDAVPVTLASGAVGGRRLGRHLVTALGDGAAGPAVFAHAAAFSRAAFADLRQAAEKRRSGAAASVALADLLADLVAAGRTVHAVTTAGGWTEVRSPDHLRQLAALMPEQVTA
ncbi:hypothetical protein AB0G32_20740, partial [Streptomyces sp. NPDC023723]|uniref:hypothetical protein n=1 Tax=Streptomyces sp. NPDC023723 TaxID=3154323 RepID=UPI0034035C07